MFNNLNGVKQRIIASEFQGSPRFDSVSISGGDEAWYGLVHLLFKVKWKKITYELAFIQWYQKIPMDETFLLTTLKLTNSFQVIFFLFLSFLIFFFPSNDIAIVDY